MVGLWPLIRIIQIFFILTSFRCGTTSLKLRQGVKLGIFPYSKTVGARKSILDQIAQKGRFPIPSQETFLPNLHQTLRKIEKN